MVIKAHRAMREHRDRRVRMALKDQRACRAPWVLKAPMVHRVLKAPTGILDR